MITAFTRSLAPMNNGNGGKRGTRFGCHQEDREAHPTPALTCWASRRPGPPRRTRAQHVPCRPCPRSWRGKRRAAVWGGGAIRITHKAHSHTCSNYRQERTKSNAHGTSTVGAPVDEGGVGDRARFHAVVLHAETALFHHARVLGQEGSLEEADVRSRRWSHPVLDLFGEKDWAF